MVTRTSRGYDAGKKIDGTNRHIAIDAADPMLAVSVTAACVQDRGAAVKPLLWNLHRAVPLVTLTWAGGGHTGKLTGWAASALRLTAGIVKRTDDLHTFKVLPRRRIVERTLSRITRRRRTAPDYERLHAHHQTYIYWSIITVMTRRLAQQPPIAHAQA